MLSHSQWKRLLCFCDQRSNLGFYSVACFTFADSPMEPKEYDCWRWRLIWITSRGKIFLSMPSPPDRGQSDVCTGDSRCSYCHGPSGFTGPYVLWRCLPKARTLSSDNMIIYDNIWQHLCNAGRASVGRCPRPRNDYMYRDRRKSL